MAQPLTYCRDCDWFVTDDEPGSRTRTRLTLDHAIETGHDVDSLRTELSTERAIAEFLE